MATKSEILLIKDLPPDQVYKRISKGIQDGVYQLIRLVKYGDQGTSNSQIPWGNAKNQTVDLPAKLDFMFSKINLLGGKWVIEAKPYTQAEGMIDYYQVEYTGKARGLPAAMGAPGQPDIHVQPTEEMISLDEYRDLVEENATLKAKVMMLESELKFTKEYIIPMQKQIALSEAGANQPTKSGWESLAEKLGEGLAKSLPQLGDVLAESLRANKAHRPAAHMNGNSNGHAATEGSPPRPADITEMSADQAVAYLAELIKEDQPMVNALLDQLEENNPAKYKEVALKLGLED